MRVFVSQLPSSDRLSCDDQIAFSRLADSLGFDGIAIAPQVGRAGQDPGTSLLQAGILARETSRVKIAVLGNSLPSMPNPAQTAAQLGWLQNMSHGRMIAGFQLGTVDEYERTRSNPADAPAMFSEAIELIRSVWSAPEEHVFDGDYWQFRLPSSRPVIPAPPVWLTGPMEREFLNLAASTADGYIAPALFDSKSVKKGIETYRKARKKLRGDDVVGRVGWQLPVYVGETDESAWAEFLPWLEELQRDSLLDAFRIAPGLYSPKTIAKLAKAADQSLAKISDRATLDDGLFVLVGSPQTVQRKLKEALESVGCDELIGLFQIGDMPANKALENIRRFARDVLPEI